MGIFKRRKKTDSLNSIEISQNTNGIDYTFEVVGESFQRDHLIQLIKKHKAIDVGEIYTTATLELEPSNDFDPNAVKVYIHDTVYKTPTCTKKHCDVVKTTKDSSKSK